MSQGVQAAERAQIEGLAGYVKPGGSPEDPTPEELEACFPENFCHTILDSGRWCLFQSVYVTTDSAGRRGNYFAHAIVGQRDTLPEPPCRYWKSPAFLRSAKDVEERVAETGDYSLPALDADALLPGTPPDKRREPSPFSVENLLAALFSSSSTGRRVVLGASPEQAMELCGQVMEALPLRWAREVTFSTYTRDPMGLKTNLDFTAVRRGQGPFGFTAAERDYTAYVFDCGANSASDVPTIGWKRTSALDALAEHAVLPRSGREARGALAFAAMTSLRAALVSGEEVGDAVAYLTARHRAGMLPVLLRRWAMADGMANAITPEDALAHLRAVITLAAADADSAAGWESAGQAARWLLQRIAFVENGGWRRALEGALDAAGKAGARFAKAVLEGGFLQDAGEFLISPGEGPRAASADVCALLARLLQIRGGEGEPDTVGEEVLECVSRALPALSGRADALRAVIREAPSGFPAGLLRRAPAGGGVSITWLAAELSAGLGPDATAAFITLALTSPSMRCAPLFMPLLYEVAALEITSGPAVERYGRIAKMLREHPRELHSGVLHPQLFALTTEMSPRDAPTMCRDYLLVPPEQGEDPGPVLDLLERGVNLLTPPEWLRGKTLERLWRLRSTYPGEGGGAPVLECLRAEELIGGGSPAREVRRVHPRFEKALAGLPRDAWTEFAGRCAARFVRRPVSQAEYVAFLEMVGGGAPDRVAHVASWIARKRMPSRWGRGDAHGLLVLLGACLEYPWPEPVATRLCRELASQLDGAASSVLDRLRDQVTGSGAPRVLRFLEQRTGHKGRLSAILRKLTRR